MSTGEIVGWVGGIVGSLIGFAGALVGTYYSVKRTNGPRERAFMLRAAGVCWVAILLFLGLLLSLPTSYRWVMWIPYSIALPVGIICGNRRQQAIRQAEAQGQ